MLHWQQQWTDSGLPLAASQAKWSEMKEHAMYRYLLHLDGASASYRLAHLFLINSLVLKQESRYIEYFYRCAGLLPGATD